MESIAQQLSVAGFIEGGAELKSGDQD